jgi:hypothetical protein
MKETLFARYGRALPAVWLLALTACGGGGGEGDAGTSTTTSAAASVGGDINATNYASFAPALAHTVMGTSGGANVA